MTSYLRSLYKDLIPAVPTVSRAERWRSCAGALLGIMLTGWLSVAALGPQAMVTLIAPMGASAVLLFGVPASPLAQPWSIVGGNAVSALIGVCCAQLVPDVTWAASLAICLAIAAMFALRCLHPPSGAVALTAVLGGPAVHAAGFGFVLDPVLLNSFFLLSVAVLYNKAVGRRYPHGQQIGAQAAHQTADAKPTARLGFSPQDLLAVLKEYKQVLDVSLDDLEELFLKTERQAFSRRFGSVSCGDIMSRDVLTVEFATELGEAWRLMHAHAVHALPVVDRVRHVIGIVTRADFLRHVEQENLDTLAQRLRALLAPNPQSHSDRPEVVGQIMSAKVMSVQDATPMVELVPIMADSGHHHVPVVNGEQRLVGMVTQSDLAAALYETSLAGAPA
ncbi:MAG: HPP family protein [Burkholderiaceae bacterium]|nr:HPP family protein [Roseateles sp.]MBV8468994.1 HPP family protein [Burkholderiaceae bacterium]